MKLNLDVITPTLNCESTLRETLMSIEPLRDLGARHIVVDSESTDGTRDLAEKWGVDLMTYPPGNMYAAVNAGVAHGSAEWVTYINGDDLLYADAIAAALERYGDETDLVYGDVDYIDQSNRFLFSRRTPSEEHLGWLMRFYNPFLQQGLLFRRSAFESLAGFDESFRFSADYDFFVRARKKGFRFTKWKESSVGGFRLSPDQLSQRLRSQMAPEGESIRARELQGTSRLFRLIGKSTAALYRVSTNLDNLAVRVIRGRNEDAMWR